MVTVELTVVGCAGSVPGPSNPGSCYLLSVTDDESTHQLVLDIGTGSFAALQGFTDLSDIDAVVVSHAHPDHCLDLVPWQVWGAHGPGRQHNPWPVWGPPGLAHRIARAYAPHEPVEELRGVFTWHTWAPDQSWQVGPMTITPHEVWHSTPAVALRVDVQGISVCYTGDTDACDGVVEAARDVDLLIAECTFDDDEAVPAGIHLTPRRLAEVAQRARARHTLVTHIPPWKDAEAVLAHVRSHGCQAEVARPGLVGTFSVGAPSS